MWMYTGSVWGPEMTERSPAAVKIGSHSTRFLWITEQLNSPHSSQRKTLFFGGLLAEQWFNVSVKLFYSHMFPSLSVQLYKYISTLLVSDDIRSPQETEVRSVLDMRCLLTWGMHTFMHLHRLCVTHSDGFTCAAKSKVNSVSKYQHHAVSRPVSSRWFISNCLSDRCQGTAPPRSPSVGDYAEFMCTFVKQTSLQVLSLC